MTETHTERRTEFLEEQEQLAESAVGSDGGFGMYFEPYGEYGAPAYQGLPNDHDIVHRIASRRAEFIEANHDIEQNHALAIVQSEMGLPAKWLAARLDVTVGTIGHYHEEVRERVGEVQYATNPFHRIDRPLEESLLA